MEHAVQVVVPIRKRWDVRPNKKPRQNGRRRPSTPKVTAPEEQQEEVDDQPHVIVTSRLILELPCTRCLLEVALFILGGECQGVACPKGARKGQWVFVSLADIERCNGKQAPR